ncbi:DNA polymerase alpha subunit B-like [Tropilaelaps mercedesae]|uniref:DNA polymerase alpha subunit B n=1 Tax=Tropilaelaps mercedesae TaxID=418985 RepID=A0A1V9XJQ9_9ACAR|nr:DNA polymerase alpha subunit B-like [Tropilaelaps mercedesae]
MVVSWEKIQEAFSLFGTTFAGDIIPDRIVSLCEKYGMEASDLCDEWMAWSKGKAMVVEYGTLDKMIQDLDKRKQAEAVPIASQKTPKLEARKRALKQSPTTGTPKRRLDGSNVTVLSASFTDGSNSSPARLYKSGKRSGQVVASYVGNSYKDTKTAEKIEVTQLMDMEIQGRLQNKNRNELNVAILERLGKLRDKFKFDPKDQLKDISGGFVGMGDLVYGLLRPPKKANLPFQLYGDYETSRSSNMPVLPKFPAFPGQIVVARVGNSVSEAKFLENPIALELPASPPKLQDKGRVRLVVAAGPYTTIDTLSYEPYHDFIDKLAQEEPDIAIMFGPFVDRNHKKLSVNLDCTFEAYFNHLVKYLATKLTGKKTLVYVVANYRENHTTSRAFPTEKYALHLENITNVRAVNDPSILDVNGIHVALSSTDVFRALTDTIVNAEDNCDMNRLSARMLLEQRSFYPVFPAHGDLIVRMPLANRTMFETRPHLLVMPATVAPFVVAEEGCLFVNPGSLVKGMDAGSYASIDIFPVEGLDSIVDTTKVAITKI